MKALPKKEELIQLAKISIELAKAHQQYLQANEDNTAEKAKLFLDINNKWTILTNECIKSLDHVKLGLTISCKDYYDEDEEMGSRVLESLIEKKYGDSIDFAIEGQPEGLCVYSLVSNQKAKLFELLQDEDFSKYVVMKDGNVSYVQFYDGEGIFEDYDTTPEEYLNLHGDLNTSEEEETSMGDLDDLLDKYEVHEDVNGNFPPNMNFAVSDPTGNIAYFEKEKDAFGFRLMKINMALNS